MNSLEVFNKFNEKLIISLPMKDVIFLAKLNSRGLFPGNLKDQVKEKSSSAVAADHFLDCSIKIDLKINKDGSFISLLSAMEEYSNQLKSLAKEIKQCWDKAIPLASGQGERIIATGQLIHPKYTARTRLIISVQ